MAPVSAPGPYPFPTGTWRVLSPRWALPGGSAEPEWGAVCPPELAMPVQQVCVFSLVFHGTYRAPGYQTHGLGAVAAASPLASPAPSHMSFSSGGNQIPYLSLCRCPGLSGLNSLCHYSDMV